MSETVEITRYPNRRLYDRSRKKYVTVGEIEAIVLAGQDVRVRDSKSSEDLTRVILTQILLERHPERMKMFPVAFLHAILRADQMALNWMAVYFGQALSFLDGIKKSRGAKLGIDFWQSLMPAAAVSDDNEPSPMDAEAESTGREPELQPDSDQQMAERLAQMERRLQQLEGDSP